jgi:hypothetical protein
MPKGCCPQCGMNLIAGQPKCWLCHAASPGAAVESVAWGLQPRVEHPSAAPSEYRLTSLLLFMTILAVLAGIIAMHRGLGIVVAIVALPVLVHACFAPARRKDRVQASSSGGVVGKDRVHSPSAGSTLAAVLLTLAMVVTVPVAAGVAFFFACASAFDLTGGRDPFAAGGMAALAVGGAVTCLFVGALVAVIRKP